MKAGGGFESMKGMASKMEESARVLYVLEKFRSGGKLKAAKLVSSCHLFISPVYIL